MRTQVLRGEAALEALMAKRLPDWQAKKVLGVARTYGLINFTVNGDRDLMSVKFIDGHYHLGDADFSGVGR